jgi:hypothetical protein
LTGTPIRTAAKAAGVSPNTIYSWLKEPTFRLALDEARRAGFFNAKDLIRLLSENAVAVLSKAMASDDLAQARLAATTILDRALALETREEFENRLIEIEKILGIKGPALLAAREDGQDRES